MLLLRHGESEWNAEGRWQGWADPPLSLRGRQQAVEAGRRLRREGFEAIVASDLFRARHTAELVAGALGLPGRIPTDAGLREYDLGAWSGLTRAQIEAEWPDELADWRHGRVDSAPGGEARAAFADRLAAAVARVATDFPDRTVLVISHGGAIGTIERRLGIRPRRPVHLGGRWFESVGGRLRAGPEHFVLGRDDEAPTERPLHGSGARPHPSPEPAPERDPDVRGGDRPGPRPGRGSTLRSEAALAD
jgi:probable phosphoglycerate mutase